MRTRRIRTALTVLTMLFAAALAVCALPRAARADDPTPVDSDTALLDALTDAGVTNIVLTNDIVTTATTFTKLINLGGYTLTVPDGAQFSSTLSNGAIAAGYAVNNGVFMNVGFSGTLYDNTNSVTGTGGSILYIWTLRLDGGASPAYVNGGTPVISAGGDSYWIPNTVSEVSSVTDASGRRYEPHSGTFYPVYSIIYYYNDNNRVTLCSRMLSLSGSYPRSYTRADLPITIPAAPSQTATNKTIYVFDFWACGGLQGKNLTLGANTSGDLAIYSNWVEKAGTGSGGTTGAGAGADTGTGSGISAAAGAAVAAGDAEAATDTDTTESEAAAAAATSTGMGGPRVRNATSVTRHSFSQTQSDTDIEALAERQLDMASLPWQWIGLGLGGVLIVFAAVVAIRRKLRERDAETLEKLNIHDG